MNKITILFMFILFACKSESKDLPVLSFTLGAISEKEYYKIDNFKLINQYGDSFGNEQTENKIYLANFFFTRCPSICPPMRDALSKLAVEFKDHNDFLIVSHSIDPKNDTVSVLKKYADNMDIPFDNWFFLTGDKAEIVSLAKKYMTNFKKTEDGTDFYHSSHTVLVDKNQNIRGFYNTLMEEEMDQLKKDLLQLIKKADL